MPLPENVLTTNELANALRVRPSTVRRWVHEGYLDPIRLGGERGEMRFDPAEIFADR